MFKTYITNLGFFELAIAAPSMKAALKAWELSATVADIGEAKGWWADLNDVLPGKTIN